MPLRLTMSYEFHSSTPAPQRRSQGLFPGQAPRPIPAYNVTKFDLLLRNSFRAGALLSYVRAW